MAVGLVLSNGDSPEALVPWASLLARSLGDSLRIVCVQVDESRLRTQRITSLEDATLDDLTRAAFTAASMLENKDVAVTRMTSRSMRMAMDELGAGREPLALAMCARDSALAERLLDRQDLESLLLDVDAPPVEGDVGIALECSSLPLSRALALATRMAQCMNSDVHSLVGADGPAEADLDETLLEKAPLRHVNGASLADALPGAATKLSALLVEFDGKKPPAAVGALVKALRPDDHDGSPVGVLALRPATQAAAKAASAESAEPSAPSWRDHLPVLARDERKSLTERLEQQGTLSADFVVLLTLSASIAAFGLLASSVAVVIGAMLVAPLMTPILAVGLSLAQSNAKLFERAARAVIVGAFLAFSVSFLIGLANPFSELSPEILSRAHPTALDLFVALFSGVAAAYALARPGLAGALVGVAVAVALVPPLAASGIALAEFGLRESLGAATLFLTNLVAIVLGAGLVFRMLGVQARPDAPTWSRKATLGLVAVSLVLFAYLSQQLLVSANEGLARAYAHPLAPSLRQAIHERVDVENGVEILFMARSGVERDFGVEIVLVVNNVAPIGLREDVAEIVRAALGPSTPVRVLEILSATEIEAP